MIDLKKKKKIGFNKPLGGGTVLQVNGAEYDIKTLRERAMAAMGDESSAVENGCKVNSFDLYVKPEDGKCYWVAKTTRGECSGEFEL